MEEMSIEEIRKQGKEIGHWRGVTQYLMPDDSCYLVVRNVRILGHYDKDKDAKFLQNEIIKFHGY